MALRCYPEEIEELLKIWEPYKDKVKDGIMKDAPKEASKLLRSLKNGLGNKDNKEILMKSKKESNEKTQIVEVTGNLEDTMTEEELKQFEEDFYLDGGPGYIPTWSSCYEPKEKK